MVLAEPPRPGECLPALEPLLGSDGCAELQAVLIERAARWAQEAAPGRAVVMAEMRAGEHEAARRARICAEAYERFGDGPLLLALAALPRLRREHAADALADLAAGSDVSFGPSNDGGYYLLAMARLLPQLFELDEDVWDGPLVLPRTIELSASHGLEGGLLRMERLLATPEDARAMLADPLTPAEVRTILERTTKPSHESGFSDR